MSRLPMQDALARRWRLEKAASLAVGVAWAAGVITLLVRFLQRPSTSAAPLVSAAEPDIRKSPKMVESFGRYLAPVSTGNSP